MNEVCKACGKQTSEIEFSVILDRGLFRNDADGPDLPVKWVDGIIKCWCGVENEVVRIL